MGSDHITRGILIGGSLGAFSNIFGFSQNMFVAIGLGMAAGLLAGLTRIWIDKRRGK